MVARQLRRLPESAARFAASTVSYGVAVVLARVVKTLTDTDARKAEPILLDAADDFGTDHAALVGRKIDDILHPDGRLSKKEEQFPRRWLKISGLLNGMGGI